MATIALIARLPYSLRINGESPCTIENKTFPIKITSITRDKPTAPWLGEGSSNVFMEDDNTDYFGYTEITIVQEFEIPTAEIERAILFIKEIPKFVIKVVNHVIQCARFNLKRHELFTLKSEQQLTLLQWRCLSGDSGFKEGVSNLFPGVLTNSLPVYERKDLDSFAAMVASGTPLTMSQKLMMDALHYRKLSDNRLAAMHLSVSFESFLHEIVATIEDRIRKKPPYWDIGKINNAFGEFFGRKIESGGESLWGEETCKNFDILVDVRNTLMHKGSEKFIVRHIGEIDLSDANFIEKLFTISDSIKDAIHNKLSQCPHQPNNVDA